MTPYNMLNVHHLEEDSLGAWTDYVNENRQSSIYHTLEWRNAFLKSFKGEDLYLIAKDGESRIAGVLPLILVNTISGKALISLPYRDRGGVVSSNVASLQELLKAAKRLCLEKSAGFVELKYCDEPGNEELDLFSSEGFLCRKTMEVVTLGLEKYRGSLLEGIKNEPLKRNIKRGLENNLTISLESDADSLASFYKLFFATRKQLGVPVYDFSLFRNLFDELSVKGYAKLFSVKLDNVNIAGGIFLLFKDIIIFGYGASDRKYLHLRPNDFLFYKVIEWGIGNGFKTLDFGGDSPLLESLINFKMKWGGEKNGAVSFFYLNGLKKTPEFDYCDARYNLARAAIKIMPDFIYNRFSKLVIK